MDSARCASAIAADGLKLTLTESLVFFPSRTAEVGPGRLRASECNKMRAIEALNWRGGTYVEVCRLAPRWEPSGVILHARKQPWGPNSQPLSLPFRI